MLSRSSVIVAAIFSWSDLEWRSGVQKLDYPLIGWNLTVCLWACAPQCLSRDFPNIQTIFHKYLIYGTEKWSKLTMVSIAYYLYYREKLFRVERKMAWTLINQSNVLVTKNILGLGGKDQSNSIELWWISSNFAGIFAWAIREMLHGDTAITEHVRCQSSAICRNPHHLFINTNIRTCAYILEGFSLWVRLTKIHTLQKYPQRGEIIWPITTPEVCIVTALAILKTL